MKLNDIFRDDETYSDYVKFASLNGYIIKEIEPDEYGRRFKVVEYIPSPEELAKGEIEDIKYWFDTFYTQHEQKYRRLHTMHKLCDDGANPYDELIKLYDLAETKRKRVQYLEAQHEVV